MNPYTSKPPTAFWQKAVSGIPSFALDPLVGTTFSITRDDRVATAGSCFAQNIARSLRANGMQYYVPETAPPGMPPDQAQAANYGTFSARFGNIYTVRQLVQLFDRALGTFTPTLSAWAEPKGGVVDPFRPLIQPGGFASEEALLENRVRHLAHVRTMFAKLSVFVFTLGLTEAWQHEEDGAIVPLAPGVAGGEADRARFGFVNFTSADVMTDIRAFHARLRWVNPAARLLLTVSPVPLIATYEDRHVLVSTTYSKSVLHAAAVESAGELEGVSYFPSYEIVTSPLNRDRYFDEDLRSVNQKGVDHVMRVFFRHYVRVNEGKGVETPAEDARDGGFASIFRTETQATSKVVCDEEAITH